MVMIFLNLIKILKQIKKKISHFLSRIINNNKIKIKIINRKTEILKFLVNLLFNNNKARTRN